MHANSTFYQLFPFIRSGRAAAFFLQRSACYLYCCLLLAALLPLQTITAQVFVHPGGLHTQVDLDRMKTQVAAGAHPWIDGWNKLITDPQAQNTYNAAPQANMGVSRQRADADAHAAYLNTIRWYISGDTSYAACAVRICNAWSAKVNQVPAGTDIPGLSGIPIFDFAMAAELLRIYPGWDTASFNRFKSMMLTYFYPVCHNFLTNHNGSCISNYWSNWDICNIGAILTMGVLCDDSTKFNEAISYFKTGPGMGSIINSVYYIHPNGMGQWQESGRDQEHAQLAVGMTAAICQVAWNQGVDLFGYDNNRLLAGAEYVARTNLSLPVPYEAYNNCKNANQRWVSINGMGRLDDRPVYEILYNHYVVRKGLSAPNVQAMAQLMRPEHGSADHFGYGTLTFTLNAAASPYPPSPAPPVPTGLTATAGVGRVTLQWQAAAGSTTQGYTIMRATSSGGPYTVLTSWADNTSPQYTDLSVTNGTTYYYVIAAGNQSGNSSNTAAVNATPVAASALPLGWARQDIGTTGRAGSAAFAPAGDSTFVTTGAGSGIGGTADAFGFTYGSISGDFTITARLLSIGGTLGKTGIMIRETLNPNAKTFVMKLGDAGWRQAGFGSRTTTGGSMSWIGGNDYTWQPAWFRLQRTGSTFTAYESSDGITWFTVGSSTATVSDTCYIGLANCSGNTAALSTTTFDHVSIISSGGGLPAAPASITGTAGNTNAQLSWSTVSGASAYALKRAATSGGPYTAVAANLIATSYTDTGLVNGTPYYYEVTAANLKGEGAASPETSVTPVLQLPVAPAALNVELVSNSQASLTWSSSLSATTYVIRRATASCGPFVIIASTGNTQYIDTIAPSFSYYYQVSAVNALGEGPVSAPQWARWGTKLSGTLLGTNGSWNNNASTTKSAAVDGNLNTYFDAAQSNGAWVGYDLGAGNSAILSRVRYAPRAGYESRMTGGVFQAAASADFSDAVTLYTIPAAPASTVLTAQAVTDSVPFRYFRYLAPNNSNGNVAEIEFWGQLALAPVITNADTIYAAADSAFHYTITATQGPTQFTASALPAGLQWTACSGSITGVPTATGNFPVVLTVSNQWGTATDTLWLIIRRSQAITLNAFPAKIIGDPDFAAGASSSSGRQINYTSSDTSVASINQGIIHLKKEGQCIITATQPGDSVYAAARPVAQPLLVNRLLLAVQYRDGGGNQPANNTIQPFIRLQNNDSVAVAYHELRLRYWLTAENYAGIQTWIDYAAIGNNNIHAQYVQLPAPCHGAWGYIEYRFDSTCGKLTPSTNSGDIQSRLANTNWALLDETDDYSYRSNATYDTSTCITLYRNGVLVWGTEPVAVPAVLSVKAYYQNRNSNPYTNTIRTYLNLHNEGNIPLSYSGLVARYWFTKDGNADLNSWIDYAATGTALLTSRFTALSPAQDSADTYFELRIDSAAGNLYPGSNTGTIQYRISKTDWSNFDETNDYAYLPAGAWASNPHITLYYQGQLVYGTEPPVAGITARTGAYRMPAANSHTALVVQSAGKQAETAAATFVYPNPLSGTIFYIKPGLQWQGKDLLINVYNAGSNKIAVKQVKQYRGGSIEMRLPQRPAAGVYLVQLNNQPAVKLLVVQQ